MRDSPSEAASRPARLGHEVGARRVGAAYDRGEALERLQTAEAELLDHDVEGAQLAAVAPEHTLAFDVEGCRPEALGDALDLGGRDEQEHGAGIDEATDEPGAGDAVDLGPGARHPDRAPLRVARRQLRLGHHRQVGGRPAERAAVKRLRRHALVTQPGGDALAELESLLADHDGGAAAELGRPLGHGSVRAPDRARDQARVGPRSPRPSGRR